MAGFSNSVCRRICREYGADGAVSEFVYSRAVLCGAKRVLEKLSFCECERPVGIQIFGSDPAEVADAASLIEERLSPDFIDIISVVPRRMPQPRERAPRFLKIRNRCAI